MSDEAKDRFLAIMNAGSVEEEASDAPSALRKKAESILDSGSRHRDEVIRPREFGAPRQAAEGYQSGFLKGAAGTAGFLSDLPGYALQAAGVELPLQLGPVGYIGPTGHAERYKESLADMNVAYRGEAPTTIGRIGEHAGYFSEAAGEFGLGAGIASKFMPIFKSAAAAPVLSNAILDPYRKAKVATVIRDLGIGTSMGTAGGVAVEAIPEGVPGRGAMIATAELAGGATPGGLARGFQSGVRRLATTEADKLPIGKVGRAVVETFQESALGQVAKDKAAQMYAKDALEGAAERFQAAQTEPTSRNIARLHLYREIQARHPGVKLNYAQITGDKGAETQLADMYRHSTDFAGRIDALRHESERVLISELEKTSPNSSAGAAIIAKHAKAQAQREVEALDAYVSQAETRFAESLKVGGAGDTPGQIATRFSEMVEQDVIRYVRDRAEQLYDDIPNVVLSSAPLKIAVSRYLNGLTRVELENTHIPGVVKSIQNYPDQIDFNEFRGIRRMLNKLIYDRNLPNVEKEMLRDVKRVSNGVLKEMMEHNPSEIVASRYMEADSFYKAAMDRLKSSTPGARLTGIGKERQVPGSATLSQYAHRGTGAKEDAEEWGHLVNWMRSSGLAEQANSAQQMMEDYLIESAFRSSGIREGSKNTANNLGRWIGAHEAMLQSFPELRLKLSNVEAAKRLFDARQLSREANLAEYQKSVASDFLGRDVDSAIDAALSPKARTGLTPSNAIDRLLKQAGDNEEVRQGIERALWDRMMRDAYGEEVQNIEKAAERAPRIVMPDTVLSFLEKNERPLSRWWSPAHIKRIREIANISKLNQIKTRSGTTRPSFETTAGAKNRLTYYRDHMTTFRNTLATGQSLSREYAKRFLDYLFEAFPDDQMVKIVEEGYLDDRVSELLLRKMSPQEAGELIPQFSAPKLVLGIELANGEKKQEGAQAQ